MSGRSTLLLLLLILVGWNAMWLIREPLDNALLEAQKSEFDLMT